MKQNFFLALKNITLDLFFPIECLGCKRGDTFLCNTCRASLPRPEHQKCPICKRPSSRGATCLDCLGKTSLDGLFVALAYQHPLTRKVIHTLKYRFIPACAAPLTNILITEIRNSELPIPNLIVPVPLHSRRLRWRGFNQSALIATHLAKSLTPGLPTPFDIDSFRRIRFTPPQASVKSKTERLNNLKDAFSWQTNEQTQTLADKTIWLIDDVATTLTTLETCAKILKQAGAKQVIGVVLAR